MIEPKFVVIVAASSILLLAPGCDGPGTGDDGAVDSGETGETADGGETGETGEPEPLDSDQDGLSDDEEAALGTDPLVKDTDQDNYWDSWEVIEGTDPLDLDSRIYTSWWPYNPNKDDMVQGSWATASKAPGSPFPRHAFLDRHGEAVDVYDFANFTVNSTGVPAPIIIDISAQWCGPCHNMAYWLGGIVSDSTIGLINTYPTVPDKVHDLQVWWMTFVVEGGDGMAPDLADAQSWFGSHPDPFIPIFSDVEQLVLQHFNGGFYPFMFLVDSQLTIVNWDNDLENGNPYYALDYVEHEL